MYLKTKYYYPLLFTLILFINSAWSQETTTQKGLLWQIDKPCVESSYLFGTMHSEDKRITQLPAPVRKHLDQADNLCLEITMGISTMFKATIGIFLKPSESLDALIEKADYQHLVKVLSQQGVPEEAIKRMKPWAIMFTLTMPKVETGLFLDKLLEIRAQQAGKPVCGLETAEEQLEALDGIALADQVILLKETLGYIDDIPEILEKMHQLYLARDLTELLRFSQEYSKSEHHQSVVEAFMKRLVDDRNVRMVERMEKWLKTGNTFIAVGALHLPGEKGILKLLEARGYQVSAIY